MNTKDKLVHLYCYVCQVYTTKLCLHCQRMSNNQRQDFTDCELLCCYLFGQLQGHHQQKAIHRYIREHWLDWFPALPSYQAFNRRLNQLEEALPALADELLSGYRLSQPESDVLLVDAMPIILSSQHPDSGKVARELAGKGYCACKKMFYHGLKLHILAFRIPGQLPLPYMLAVSSASAHDLTVLRIVLPQLSQLQLYADKLYADEQLRKSLEEQQAVSYHTPKKRKMGQEFLQAADNYLATAIAVVRQPIESLFAWLQAKTDIQNASKVRSTAGALVHCFGKVAAACLFLAFNY